MAPPTAGPIYAAHFHFITGKSREPKAVATGNVGKLAEQATTCGPTNQKKQATYKEH
jgi:hypothetical protein